MDVKTEGSVVFWRKNGSQRNLIECANKFFFDYQRLSQTTLPLIASRL